MAHGYRTLQHWNDWLTGHFLGEKLLEAESQSLMQLLSQHFGKHALLLGVPAQQSLLKATPIPCHTTLSPFITSEKISSYIESDFHQLPILTGTLDLVMLPHTLEFIDHPRQLLAEACRIIKPEGLIIICGFNPYSLWGMRKLFAKNKTVPWATHTIPPQKVKNWLRLADFQLEKQSSLMFVPPVNRASTYDKLHFLEKVGSKCWPLFGGVNVLVARAKVIPLTPIRLKWKQQLSGVRISNTLPGNIAHQNK